MTIILTISVIILALVTFSNRYAIEELASRIEELEENNAG